MAITRASTFKQVHLRGQCKFHFSTDKERKQGIRLLLALDIVTADTAHVSGEQLKLTRVEKLMREGGHFEDALPSVQTKLTHISSL